MHQVKNTQGAGLGLTPQQPVQITTPLSVCRDNVMT